MTCTVALPAAQSSRPRRAWVLALEVAAALCLAAIAGLWLNLAMTP